MKKNNIAIVATAVVAILGAIALSTLLMKNKKKEDPTKMNTGTGGVPVRFITVHLYGKKLTAVTGFQIYTPQGEIKPESLIPPVVVNQFGDIQTEEDQKADGDYIVRIEFKETKRITRLVIKNNIEEDSGKGLLGVAIALWDASGEKLVRTTPPIDKVAKEYEYNF